jgi:glycosyltransferase involved in cell wall biosynthesis
MRILQVIGIVDPAWGGPPRVAVRLAAAQAAMGHETHLLSYVADDATDWLAEQSTLVPAFDRVTVHRMTPASLWERLTATRARRILGPLTHRMDWVHIHGVWERLLSASASMAFAAGVPYCIRPAGMLDHWSLTQKRWKKGIAMALGYRKLLQRAAFFHTLTHIEAEFKARLQLRPPCEHIPNGVFLEEIDPLPPAGCFRAKCERLGDRRFILFIARLHHKKGLDLLAEAFRTVAARAPDVDLVVAGPDDGAKESFEQAIAAAGLSGRVHVVGPVYMREKIAALRDSDCFCLPSREEGFSVAVLEALAVGVPVVISEQCNFHEVQRCGAGFVTRLDAGEIAAGLMAALSSPSNRDVMGAAGRALIAEQYTWRRVAAATIAAYEKYLDPAAPLACTSLKS